MMPRQPKPDPKPCRKCVDRLAVLGERYCKSCKHDVLKEMESSGYLTDTRPAKARSEQYGRKAISSETIGGSAEIGADGDDTV